MRVPLATYRLQFGEGFDFEDARKAVSYLDELGISDVYASPIFTARPGTSGYHVLDPAAVAPALGGRDGFEAFTDELLARGMGLLLDIVPNHMAATSDSPWWMDVLRRGKASKYASFFDVDWDRRGGKVLVPALGAPLDEVLESDQFSVGVESGEPVVRYHDHVFPVDPATVAGAGTIRELLDRQHYVLASWRDAAADVNYRRFFDISDLVSLRQEEPAVFEATHALVLELVGEGRVTGLRIDHVDGLRDPQDYLHRLRAAVGDDVPIYVEKILAPGEDVPEGWPVEGTTGYEFAAAAGDLAVDPDGFRVLREAAASLTDQTGSFEDLAIEKKRLVQRQLFVGQIRTLVDDLRGIVGTRGPSREALEDALIDVTACLPVYRTYIRDRSVSERDRKILDRALRLAGRRQTKKGKEVLQMLRRILLLQRSKAESLEFVLRWQQLTGPVAAKGVEDTALYDDPALISRNDVGFDPGVVHGTTDAFHRAMKARAKAWPRALSATSTHDSKRSEDVRARIDVISEVAGPWNTSLARWRRALARLQKGLDPGEELILLQTLVGAWPLDLADEAALAGRLEAHLIKVAREAKAHTSWLDPDQEHERTLVAVVRSVLGKEGESLRSELAKFRARIEVAGAVNSLAQTLLKITCPGVPDFYQGTERWFLRLVDPDNREPVDLDGAAALRTAEVPPDPKELVLNWRDGRIKEHVIRTALGVRREHAELFASGTYVPVRATGERADRIVAFARRRGTDRALVVVPRLIASLTARGRFPVGARAWKDTTIAVPKGGPHVWVDGLTGQRVTLENERIAVTALLRALPVALLVPAQIE